MLQVIDLDMLWPTATFLDKKKIKTIKTIKTMAALEGGEGRVGS